MKKVIFVSLILLLQISINETIANQVSEKEKSKSSLSKAVTFSPDQFAILNINNLTTWQKEDGKSNHSPQNNEGVFFPRNTSHVIYQDGITWGAKAYLDSGLTIPAPFTDWLSSKVTLFKFGLLELV